MVKKPIMPKDEKKKEIVAKNYFLMMETYINKSFLNIKTLFVFILFLAIILTASIVYDPIFLFSAILTVLIIILNVFLMKKYKYPVKAYDLIVFLSLTHCFFILVCSVFLSKESLNLKILVTCIPWLIYEICERIGYSFSYYTFGKYFLKYKQATGASIISLIGALVGMFVVSRYLFLTLFIFPLLAVHISILKGRIAYYDQVKAYMLNI